jgi:methylated-DNA-[protein]-cysteine S-methyltransferase
MKEKRLSNPEKFYDVFESTLGTLYIIFVGKNLCGIEFKKPIKLRKGQAPAQIKKELGEYFESGRSEFSQKIVFTKGTDFEQAIWRALKEIPYGETRTYKWLASKIGKPSAARAVGQALSRNPVPIILPCHRVIESDGSMGGYSAGVHIKRRLLDMEYYTQLGKKNI